MQFIILDSPDFYYKFIAFVVLVGQYLLAVVKQ
jgi:hypothetical protein